MLFTGWEVRIVKNCDRGLENAAWGRRPRAAFSSLRSQFFTIPTYPKLSNEKNSRENLTQALLWPWSNIGKSGPRQSDCRIRYRARLEKKKNSLLFTEINRLSYLPSRFNISGALLHLKKFDTMQPYSPELFFEASLMRYAQVLVSSLSESVIPPHSLISCLLKNNSTRNGCWENCRESPCLDLFPVQTIVRL